MFLILTFAMELTIWITVHLVVLSWEPTEEAVEGEERVQAAHRALHFPLIWRPPPKSRHSGNTKRILKGGEMAGKS